MLGDRCHIGTQDEHNFHKQKTYRKAARPLVKVGVSQPQSDKRALGERLSCSVTAQAPPRCQRHRYKGQLWRIHTRSDSCGGRGLSRFYIEIPEMGGGVQSFDVERRKLTTYNTLERYIEFTPFVDLVDETPKCRVGRRE